MPPPRQPLGPILDPQGYYARLGVEPGSRTEEITAAYRRKARVLHPDVPVTGDANSFVELKQAYDVLVHGVRRAAYDRSARQPVSPAPAHDREPGEIGAKPFPTMATPPTRHPRLRDLPIMVWIGMAAVLLVGIVEVGLHLSTPPAQQKRELIPATAADVPPIAAGDPRPALYGPAPVHLAGTPNYYIVPTASAAMLWRVDEARHTFTPWGQLPAFSSVQALRLLKPSGMVEVKVTDGTNGYVQADRLTPGDTAAASRAWCTYNAGPTPENGEVLSHTILGHAALSVTNRTGQLAVVKIRSAIGGVVASMFLGPGGETSMGGLPDDPVQVEFATGEVWSRACRSFAAGMRAQRLPGLVSMGLDMQLAIPPDARSKPIDIPDQAFAQE